MKKPHVQQEQVPTVGEPFSNEKLEYSPNSSGSGSQRMPLFGFVSHVGQPGKFKIFRWNKK